MKERPLTATEGKVLRYVVDRAEPVKPSETTNRIAWSDLPHSYLQARAVLERLKAWKYVERVAKGYIATEKGRKRIARANKGKEWLKPPPPAVTNKTGRSARD